MVTYYAFVNEFSFFQQVNYGNGASMWTQWRRFNGFSEVNVTYIYPRRLCLKLW